MQVAHAEARSHFAGDDTETIFAGDDTETTRETTAGDETRGEPSPHVHQEGGVVIAAGAMGEVGAIGSAEEDRPASGKCTGPPQDEENVNPGPPQVSPAKGYFKQSLVGNVDRSCPGNASDLRLILRLPLIDAHRERHASCTKAQLQDPELWTLDPEPRTLNPGP